MRYFLNQAGELFKRALGQRDLSELTADQQALYNESYKSLRSMKYMDQATRDSLIETLPELIKTQDPLLIRSQISKMLTLDKGISDRRDLGYGSSGLPGELNEAARSLTNRTALAEPAQARAPSPDVNSDTVLKAESPAVSPSPLSDIPEPPTIAPPIELPLPTAEKPSALAEADPSASSTSDAVNLLRARLTAPAPDPTGVAADNPAVAVASPAASAASNPNTDAISRVTPTPVAPVDLDQLHKAELKLSTRIQSLKSEGRNAEDNELQTLKARLKELQTQNKRIIAAAKAAGTLTKTDPVKMASSKVKRRTESPDELTEQFNGMNPDEQVQNVMTCKGAVANRGSPMRIMRLAGGRTDEEFQQDLLKLYKASKNAIAFSTTLAELEKERASRQRAAKQAQAAASGVTAPEPGPAKPVGLPGAPKPPTSGVPGAPKPPGAATGRAPAPPGSAPKPPAPPYAALLAEAKSAVAGAGIKPVSGETAVLTPSTPSSGVRSTTAPEF